LDIISTDRRSQNMQRIRSQNTLPELCVRRLIYKMGYRYRVNVSNLPGKPDIVFAGRRKVIFVHGCFWHRHADPSCPFAHIPQSKQDYWLPKLERTIERDIENLNKYEQLGWATLIIWECETKDLVRVAERVQEFLELSSTRSL